MVDYTRDQTWHIVHENAESVLESGSREPLNKLVHILDSKVNFPFRFELNSSNVIIKASTVQTLKTNGTEDTNYVSSYNVATPPIGGVYKELSDASFDVSSGSYTGSFLASSLALCPSMTPNYFVWVGIVLGKDGNLTLVWGLPAVSKVLATYPKFIKGNAVGMICLENNGTAGAWHFNNPNPSDITIFKGAGGGSGGLDTYSTVLDASLELGGSDNDISFVVETETFYRYESTDYSTKTADSTYLLAVASDPNARWVGVGGKYTLNNNYYQSQELEVVSGTDKLVFTTVYTFNATQKIDVWNNGILLTEVASSPNQDQFIRTVGNTITVGDAVRINGEFKVRFY